MKNNTELKEKYIEYYSDAPIQRYAAMWIGKNEDTILRWKKEDADFAERIKAARADWVRKRVNKSKVEFALERIEKEVFSEKKQFEVTTPPEELEEIRRILKDARTKPALQDRQQTDNPDSEPAKDI